MKTEKIDLKQIPIMEIREGDKLIAKVPKTLAAVDFSKLATTLKRFMSNPKENILIIPEGFQLFLLRKEARFELESIEKR